MRSTAHPLLVFCAVATFTLGVGLTLTSIVLSPGDLAGLRAVIERERSTQHDRRSPPPRERRRVEDECERAWGEWVATRDSVPLRVLTLRAFADEEFRRSVGEGWEDDVRARIARGSKWFERELRVSLRLVGVETWTSDDRAPDLHALHRGAQAGCVRDDADLAIVFSSQHKGPGPLSYDRGVAYYYGRSVVLRTGEPNSSEPWPYEDETFIHEVLHLFGAWHEDDASSVMRTEKSGGSVTSMDVVSAATALLLRDLDFRRGPDGVSDVAWETITRRWCGAWRWDVPHPGIDAYNVIASRAHIAGRQEEARAAAQRGVALADRLQIELKTWLRDVAAGRNPPHDAPADR